MHIMYMCTCVYTCVYVYTCVCVYVACVYILYVRCLYMLDNTAATADVHVVRALKKTFNVSMSSRPKEKKHPTLTNKKRFRNVRHLLARLGAAMPP
jgi:hypothetical protein